MMNLTPQTKIFTIQRRASHPSSVHELDTDFRKLVDKLEQAEIIMRIEVTKIENNSL